MYGPSSVVTANRPTGIRSSKSSISRKVFIVRSVRRGSVLIVFSMSLGDVSGTYFRLFRFSSQKNQLFSELAAPRPPNQCRRPLPSGLGPGCRRSSVDQWGLDPSGSLPTFMVGSSDRLRCPGNRLPLFAYRKSPKTPTIRKNEDREPILGISRIDF